MIRTIAVAFIVGGLLGGGPVAAANAGQLLIPPDDLPAALEGLGPLDIARGFAMSPDGQRAAIGVPDPFKPKGGYVRFTSDDGTSPAEVAIKGRVLQVCFDPSLPFIYALGQRPGRKDILDAFVARIDVSAMTADRLVTLPATASDVSLWIHRPALLVSSQDEIRSIILPAGRSGPLYQVPGDNRAIASLPGTDRVLVGQDMQILLIDLSDPQGPDAMPIRETLEVSTPVARMVPSPDGEAALVRFDDGRVFTLRLDPMRLEDERSAEWIAWTGEPLAYRPPTPAVVAPAVVERAEPDEPEVVETPRAQTEPEPVTVEVPAAAASEPEPVAVDPTPPPTEPKIVAEEPTPAPIAPEPEIVEPEPAASPPEPTTPEPEPSKTEPEVEKSVALGAEAVAVAETPVPETSRVSVSADPSKGDAEGKLTGPAVSEVVDVVLHGPNNIMREAARVRPESDGTWSIFGLEPGRYRVILDGGGGRVLQTQPSFRTIEVTAGSRVTVESIHVSGTL